MKLHKLGIILALIFLFTIGAVSSQDVNQTDELTVDSSDEIEIISASENTFTDLNKDISNGDVINLNKDYTYDKNTDKNYTNGVSITKNLTINGNNHVIDGSAQSRIFSIISGNIIINNLIIKNANNSAIFIKNATLTTNNVTFENNVGGEDGGVIHAEKVNYTSVNDKFINNFAKKYGAAIFIQDNSTLIINNDIFKSDIHLYWGLIEIRKSKMTITNTNFSNMTSQYTNAIHAEETEGIIKNCNFDNLYANITAGALAIKEIKKEIIIDNCTFRNVSSRKNAGAVFSDIAGGNPVEYDGSCIISNSQFINCSSEFGGAFIQLGGALKISNSIFRDNNAYYDGGAVYISYVVSNFENLVFINNKADQSNNSGAIFSDLCNLKITKTNFTDNKGSIYIYDSNYTISNSNFKGNQVNIYSFFDGKTAILKNNYYADGNNTLNQIDYRYTYEIKNIPIDYNPINFDLSLINASSFDLRDYGLVTSVKNQGRMGSCWTFATAAALESALLKATNGTLSVAISENNERNLNLHYYIHGGESEEGGNGDQGAVYFLSLGGLEEKYDLHDELGKISPVFKDISKYYPYEAIFIESRQDIYDNYRIKEALVKYGALAVSLLSPGVAPNDYDNITHAAFSNKTDMSDHAVTLVGWDDNYSASNFKITPPGNGAWIIKNSWDTDWGENGYYYVSYYDASAFIGDVPLVGFVIAPEIPYNKIYQYDVAGGVSFLRELSKELTPEEIKLPKKELIELLENRTIASNFTNTFVADGNDIISAIGTYFEKADIDYTIKISVKGREIYTQNGKSTYGGFEIIKLDKQINVNKGETFSVNLIAKKSPTVSSRNKIPANASIKYTKGKIVDLTSEGCIAAIKVYTNPSALKNVKMTVDDVEMYFGGSEKLIVKLVDINNNPLNNVNVSISINGNDYIRPVNNGTASLGLNLNSGQYIVKVLFNGTGYYDAVSDNATVIVKNTIDASDIVKMYRNATQFYATFVDSEGDCLKNTVVTFNIKGMYYNRTTNENGTAKLNINLNPGDYIITSINPITGENAANNITVLSKITENYDLVKYYRNASQYTVKLLDDQGNAVGAGVSVTFNINGVFYTRTTNTSGIAKLNINLQPGDYIIIAEYEDYKISNNIKVLPVLSAGDLSMHYRDGSRFEAKLLDGLGEPFKGENIQFNINGVLYNRITDGGGIARLNINLMAGEYIITSSYNGTNIANKITIA